MLISHEWLRAFVPHTLSPDALRALITAHVATVDGMERLRADLASIVVARVITAGRHPNSDHLWVTKVDDGSGELVDVVCGAPNVIEGAMYPFARVGTVMPTGNKGGILIERRKIRGEVSCGMLCSARELGLGEDHDGILALDIDVPTGTPFLEAVAVGDVQYDIDVLANRPDLLSHYGMAREVAALHGGRVRDPDEVFTVDSETGTIRFGDGVHGRVPSAGGTVAHDLQRAGSGGAQVQLDDADGCPRYMGVVIRGVAVGPSPEWLVRRLAALGLRSISNVVDVTNYMLHGYGQPMHAFDLSRLAGQTVVVRRAHPGEVLVTLDGVSRTLEPRMTVIADAERAVAVAGVMGGLDSEVTASTTDLFLEVAYFTPRHVRETRRALGLSTDASYRFERGIDPAIAPHALSIAAQLITMLAGGAVDGQAIDVGRVPEAGAPVAITPKRVARLLGASVSAEEIGSRLASIGFGVTPRGDGDETLDVVAPSWRHDVSRDVDLIEEIARLRGYDALPDDVLPFRPGNVPDHPLHVTGRRVRDALVGMGLFEVRPLPFVAGADDTHARVQNPLADDEPHLRTSILETLARRAEYNLSRMQGNVRLFEIGSTFAPRPGQLPVEKVRVGLVLMGLRRPGHFTDASREVFDAWDAKALGERVAEVAYPGMRIALEAGDGAPVLWRISAKGGEIGTIEVVALDKPVWASEAFGIEITLGRLANAAVSAPGSHDYGAGVSGRLPAKGHVTYQPLPTTPPAEFDLALLVPDGVSAAQVEHLLRKSAGELLERLELFDEFRGTGVPAGHRSVAWRLTFRDATRTLRDKEVDGRRQKILRTLETELGVRPRTA
ncbi:MAG: phenylalanine--tRNA ligase subunit beta [Gemmatimonadetes bacterium]|nr:phenylalanine--tRNA ligase subunit beta [Gemmatimonadota bacterium]